MTTNYSNLQAGNVSCPASAFKIFMEIVLKLFIEKQPPAPDLKNTYDFIVVGGGTAGSVVANRLSEISSWSVLLLEAGVEQPNMTDIPAYFPYVYSAPNLTWLYPTIPEPQSCGGQSCFYPRGKMLGGSSSHNGMFYNRGNRKCFDNWRKSGNKGWSFNEVLPYFKKSEDNRDKDIALDKEFHSVGGELSVQRFQYHDQNFDAIMEALEEKRFPVVDFNGESQNGRMWPQYTIQNGTRVSTNTAFLEPIRKTRKNLVVVTGAFVTKVLISRTTRKVYGVECVIKNSEKKIIFATKEVILSAGVINSPQILQLSGVGPAEILSPLHIPVIKNLQGVGRNFQDHALTSVLNVKVNKAPKFPKTWKDLSRELDKYLKNRDGPLSGTSTPNLYWSSKNSHKEIPDMFYIFFQTNVNNYNLSNNCYNFGSVVTSFNYYNSITVIPMLVTPKSRGSVLINSSDPFVAPLIIPNLLSNSDDMEALVEANQFGVEILQSDTLKQNGIVVDRTPISKCSHLEFGTKNYWKCVVWGSVWPGFHGVGTCKMGPKDDLNAVVDSNIKVHGISGLRVIDASIMPEIVNAHTYASTVMIGEKGADLIKQTWLTV
ncbi:Glucose dehydrogenase [FAD, quinone] [Blattella germanica]|nr:Glucose dehydrogenase [FAD, quinone] [Blattella germanica]